MFRLVEVFLAAELCHVEKYCASDDAAVGNRFDAGLLQAADSGISRVSVPQGAVVPDMAECVVLRRALQERVDLVVRVMQAAGEVGCVVAVPAALVEDLCALGGAPARPDRITLGIAD